MGIAKMVAAGLSKAGDGVRVGGKGVTKSGADNANRWTPSLTSDVVKSQKADNAKIKKGLDAAADNVDNNRSRQSQQLAGGRATTRTAGRAGALAATGVFAYDQGSRANEANSRAGEAKKAASAPAPAKKAAPASEPVSKKDDAPAKKADEKKKDVKKASSKIEAPRASLREGRNNNIDDDSRKKALDSITNLNKGGMVKRKC